ncbi:MAG: HlyC/CorC family transporter [Phycisphaerales bacterium]|nr:HlyC/CorC family transporter [Phycisphaerales bacterium]
MSAGWWIILASVMAVGSAVCSSIVLALATLSRSKLASEAEDESNSSKATRLEIIERDPDGHAAPVSFLALGFQCVTLLSTVFWAGAMRTEQLPGSISILAGLLVGTVILWIGTTLIGFGIAQHCGEQTIALFSRPIRVLHAIFTPVLPLVGFFNEVVRRLVGTAPQADEEQVSAQILSVVSEIEREGHIDETERDMLEAVVEFRTTLVESVMTPRTEVDALEYTDDLSIVQEFIDEHGHSRVPVYEENLDHIRGILYAKDLLRWITRHGNNGHKFVLEGILREPTLVPETKTVRELLSQLLADKVHIAIILDEYGGTSGLVTIEDIIEEIFGEIQDEYENPGDEPDSVQINLDEKSAIIDARTEIDDANDELEVIGLDLPESDDYDTVAGYINTTLGRIPDAGEVFATETMSIKILDAEPTRVLSLCVTALADNEPEPESSSK